MMRAIHNGLFLAALGCSSGASVTGLEIVSASGDALNANAGDALKLKVVQRMSDGTTTDLPAGSTVQWTEPLTVNALDPDSTAASPVPAPGSGPTGFFIDNGLRPDHAGDLTGVLFLLDPGREKTGTLTVGATVTGTGAGVAIASVSVGPTPVGDAARGATVYGVGGADCAFCHGATGHGSSGMAADGTEKSPKYSIAGREYPFPAPGLNAEDGNAGSDPAWNAALFATAARADMDNGGLELRLPMPDWLTIADGGSPPTTQDLVDVYAFMKTQKK